MSDVVWAALVAAYGVLILALVIWDPIGRASRRKISRD